MTTTTLTKQQINSPYLTTIQAKKREFYPKFGEKILEFSISDVTIKKTRNGDIYCIGVRILGGNDKYEMIDIRDLNIGNSQSETIRVAFKVKIN